MTRNEMRRALLGGARAGLNAGEIDQAQFVKIRRLAWFHPKAQVRIDGEEVYLAELIADEMNAAGYTAVDGSFAAVDWEKVFDLVSKLLPLILEFIKLLGI